MKTRSKLIIAGLTAALLMSLAVNSASANRLSLSHGSLWRAQWESLSFGIAGVNAARCPVTLEGSFHSTTIAKVERALIGYVSRAGLNGACQQNTATVLSETLPWHVQYLGFIGTLPRIERVRLILVGVAFRISAGVFGECLARASATEPASVLLEIRPELYERNAFAVVRTLTAEPNGKIQCGTLGKGEFSGEASLREVPSGAENVLIRLI